MAAPPVLIEVVRDGYVESVHRGSIVLLEPAGVLTAGTADDPVFPRSALKPLQSVAMLDAGFIGRGASLALSMASHDGEAMHVDGARATLAAAGLDESALQCPAALPGSQTALIDWVRGGGSADPICHNCSGKHAAMLATCVAAGLPLPSYRDPAHPLQQQIRDRIEVLTGVEVSAVAVDGCGAPAFAVTLTGLATAFARLASAGSGPSSMVANAMRRHPLLIGGTTRAASLAMAAVPGLICKDGAEGVWAAALPDGRAFAAKFEDGGARALPVLLAAVLARWAAEPSQGAAEPSHSAAEPGRGAAEPGHGAAEPGQGAAEPSRWAAELSWGEVPVLGGGVPVGSLRPSPWLAELLSP
ncbi:asparaginase [Jatrophihabitans sp.]|uniref:asparaginase n=1 Tax=Jatrophihabitans sp. TaxID=1932789 RepID=UPI0030C72266|nr:asparaginase [Jatrophihabitans sp.]